MSWPDELAVLRALLVKITIGPRRTDTPSPSPGNDPGDHKNDIRTGCDAGADSAVTKVLAIA